jgi:solute carrier family 10 (sodium/bile acid cotransporter), member 7
LPAGADASAEEFVMSGIRALLSRLPIDGYLLLLMATVGLAAVLPAQGEGQSIADMAVYAAVAALFFLYGARLSPRAVWEGLAHWRLQSLVLASTFVLFPLVGLGIEAVVGHRLPHDIVVGLMFVCVLPSTVQSSIAFTSIARGNVPAALCSASVSSLLGVALTPLLVAMLLPSTGGGFSFHRIEDLALQILLPFIVGQAVRPLIGDWLLRHRTLTSVVDRGSILLVVYAAFSAGVVAGVWTQLSIGDLVMVLGLDAVMLAIVLTATTLVSRWLRFSVEDEIAIVLCGSKKSMAGGIPMATILFPGHAVSLIVLPLMLFHQVQLFVCATLARRYAARASGRQDSSGVLVASTR